MATNFLQAMGLPYDPNNPYGSPGASAVPPAPPIVNAPPVNVMQTLANPPAAPAAPTAPIAPARARSSLIDKIGRVADVLATVGGAPALYQPTLDARQDRSIALDDHTRQVDMDKLRQELQRQQITLGEGSITDANSARLQKAAQGIHAIKTANPDANIAAIWPVLAKQMGIPDDQAGIVGQAAAQNPDIFEGLSGTPSNLGKNLYFGTDANGKTVAYQIGTDGTPHILDFGGSVTPSEPTKVVNTGGSSVIVGQSGQTKKILPNTERPGAAADRASREKIAAGNNQTAITIAGMPARAQPGKTGAAGKVDPTNGLTLINNIQQGFSDLHGLKALPGDQTGVVGNVLGALSRSSAGQYAGEQMGSAAAQKRLAVQKNIAMLQQDLIKSLPASATRTKFEQEIVGRSLPDPSKMSYSTALGVLNEYRQMYAKAVRDAQAELAAKGVASTPSAPAPAPKGPVRPAAPKPSSSNW